MDPKIPGLPDEIIKPATYGRCAWTVLCALLMVIAVNLLARHFLGRRGANQAYWLIENKWRLLHDLSGPVDWVILGDSSCNQGVRPRLLAPEPGVTAVNLCTIADTLVVHDAWMLAAYVARHGRPRRGVIIVHVYDVWEREGGGRRSAQLLARMPLPWGFWRQLDPPLKLSAGEQLDLLLARYAPLYAEHRTFAALILDPRSALGAPPVMDATGYMAEVRAAPAAVRRDAQGHLEHVRGRSFVFSALNRMALGRIGRLADQLDVSVYLASSPLFQGLYQDVEFRRYYDEVQRGLAEASGAHRRLRPVLTRPVTFSADQMTNADHLTHPAAADYTRALAAAIARAPR